jgi:acetyl esterase
MRDSGETAVRFQLLIYGVYSTGSDSPSWQRFGRGAGLSQTQMRWIWETYLAGPAQQQDWRAAPILADLKGVAPAHLIVGSLDSWDHFLRDLVRQSGVAALSVDYQLSPEVKFPVAFDETVAMIRLAAREGSGFGIDPSRLAAGGDSAGANLALAAAVALRDAGDQALSFLLLVYGVYTTDSDSASWRQFGRGAGLSQTQMKWIWETYLENPGQMADTRAAPGLADLKGLPPAHLIVGSLDPLLDDSNRLAAQLDAAGVANALTVYQGISHGFIRYGKLIGTARRAIADCAAALKTAIG